VSADARRCDIGLDQAVAGMTLAAALCDANGGVLLPQDAELTDASLASLRRRGVERCVVWAGAEPADPAQRERERERRLLRLRHLFRHSGAGAGGALLLERLSDYRQRERP